MLYGKKINQIKISKEEKYEPKNTRAVAPEKYDLYKKTKKEYIKKQGNSDRRRVSSVVFRKPL